MLCFQEEEMLAEKVEGFPVLHDKRVKGFKEKDTVQKMPGRKQLKVQIQQKKVILLEQVVATENILKIPALKKKVLCSVSEILTKYQQTNLIFADVILEFGRLTIQNSSSK